MPLRVTLPEDPPPPSSWFTLDDHSSLRYLPPPSARWIGIWDLFSGCGGKVDMCGVIEEGDCGDRSGSVPVQVEKAPPYGYDLGAQTRAALKSLSAANPCLLDGLNGIRYDELEVKGGYLTESRRITIDPLQMPAGVSNVEEHWLVMRFRLFHELGHHIFHYVLPSLCDTLRSRFAGISWQGSGAMRPGMNPDVDTGDFLNADALKNADEDFAVCLSYYFVFPDEFRTRAQTSAALARKYDFIRALLRGIEY